MPAAFLPLMLVIMLMSYNECGSDLFVSQCNTWHIHIINDRMALKKIVMSP